MKPTAILIHVASLYEAKAWYLKAFPMSQEIPLKDENCILLDVEGFAIELVLADSKVPSGKAGTVLYWSVPSLQKAIDHFRSLGSTLYRGPMAIENGLGMCQVSDPFGNLIGLRGEYRDEDSTT